MPPHFTAVLLSVKQVHAVICFVAWHVTISIDVTLFSQHW